MRIRNTAALLIICLFAASAHAAQVSVEPSYMEISKGENFTVDIYVDPDGSEVYGAQYDLYFNNTVLNATLQTKGPFLGEGTNMYNNGINNTIGKIGYGEARSGVSYGVFNPGILATITFRAIAEEDGISELRLENVKLSDLTANPDSIQTNVSSGNVSVRTGVCGDATGDDKVTMADGRRIYMHKIYGTPLDCSPWAADVTGDGKVTMADGRRIYMHKIYGTPLNCK